MNLHIKVVEAVDVPKMDVFSKSDPYCIVSLSNAPGRQRTRTIQNNDHPIWNQEFHFPIQNKKGGNTDNFGSIKLSITLYDEDTFSKDDIISSIEIPLNDYIVGRVYDEWYTLFPAKKLKEGGRIHLVVNIVPKDVKPFTSMATNSMNPVMMNPNLNYNNYNYNVSSSQLPQLNQVQMNQNPMYMQRQPTMNQYQQVPLPVQQPMNPYMQQQQRIQQMQSMQQIQQMQRVQQMQRMQVIQSNPYMVQQPQFVYNPIPGYNYSHMNGNMMYGAVPPPTQNVYPTVAPSQLPPISNQQNNF